MAKTAMKVKQHNDYSVFGVFGVTRQGKMHLLDLVRGKWEAPELKKRLIELWNKWLVAGCSAVYIEDKASGVGLLQELKALTGIPIIGLEADKDKLTRIESALPHIESGNLLLPQDPTYGSNPDILSECEAFTRDDSHKHDDIVDVIGYAIKEGLSQMFVSIFDVV